LLTIFLYNKVYINSKIYNNLGDKKLINIWSSTQQFQIRGFIYPFIYSSRNINIAPPNNYNKETTKNYLKTLNNYNIPNDKKINIISIMLEAYNDFSVFEGVKFNVDIYKNYNAVKEEAISGNIISNVFGGGTINTERSYLTGFYLFPNLRSKTNSFVWYFKSQGYYTEAMHPIYGWFYNRRNVNLNLGFDNYDFYENKYCAVYDIQFNSLNDVDFFEYIIKGYEDNKRRKQPYFNFTVTYQNHGPYSPIEQDNEYLKNNNNIDKETYNMLNMYFSGIYNTDIALGNLINYLGPIMRDIRH
ncbi:MAG: LTA synthase family protein, partial [Bacilli bacterium]